MNPIDPITSTLPSPQIEKEKTRGLIEKIWDIVAHFFTFIAEKIQGGFQSIRNLFKNPPLPFEAMNLTQKLNLYKNIPEENFRFVEKAIDLFQKTLPSEDLSTFNQDWASLKNSVILTSAVVRAYIFSNIRKNFDFEPLATHGVQLIQLRALFNRLPDSEKEFILSNTDFSSKDKGSLSIEAKNILGAIEEISIKGDSQNGPFFNMLKEVHKKKFKPNF